MKVLVFFAHPDDESMFGGGTLALLASQGAEIHYLCATRGEGGEWGKIPHNEDSNLGKVREQELVAAVQAIGGARSLTFLGYTDPKAGEDNKLFPFTENITVLAGQVGASIQQIKPDLVISHGSDGEYGHPAHIVCHQAALTAVLAETEPPLFYGFGAYFAEHPDHDLVNQSDPASFIVDVSSVLQHKLQAAQSHKSQNMVFKKRWEKREGREVTLKETLILEEGFHKFHPQEDKTIKDVFVTKLNQLGVIARI